MKYSLQKRISAFVLAFALVMTTAFNSIGATTKADAAAKVKALYVTTGTSVSIEKGASKTVKFGVRATKATKAMAKVSLSGYDKSVVSVSKVTYKKAQKTAKKAKKSLSYFKVTGVAAGSTSIKITTKKKTKKSKTIKVTVTDSTATTQAPSSADAATTTQAPASANATTEDVTEFALVSVESAVESASGSYKYLKVKFSKKIDSLAASEVSIRRKSDEQLYTIEKVTLDADGMGAYVELLGDASAAGGSYSSGINFLEANTPYIFRVEKAGEKAAIKEFVIPASLTNVTITEVDPAKKTIKVETTSGRTETLDASANAININYFDALGRIATVKYNEKGELASLKFTDSGVVYGTFKSDKDVAGKFTDTATNKVYNAADDAGTDVVKLLGKSGYSISTSNSVKDFTFGIAKLVLNANNKVSSIVFDAPLTATYVTSSDGTRFVTTIDKEEKNVKDYTFIKGDSYASIKDVKMNSTLFLDSTKSIAFIYENSEVVTLDKASIYDDKAKIGASEVEYTKLTNKLYIDGNQVAGNPTYSDFEKAQAGGPITVFKNAAGDIVYIIAKSGAVKTTKETFILASKFLAAKNMNDPYLQGTLMNESKTINLSTATGDNMLPLSQIKNVTLYDGSGASVSTNEGVAADTTWYTTGSPETEAVIDGKGSTTITDVNLNSYKVGSIVVVEYNDSNKIIGLTVYDATTAGSPSLAKERTIQLAANNDLKVGMKADSTAITTTATTPVYVVTLDSGNITKVVKNNLSSYSTKLQDNTTSFAYVDDKSNTTCIVTSTTDLGTTTDAAKTVIGIVTDVTTADNKLVRVKYIAKGDSDATEVTSFDATDASIANSFTLNGINSIGFKEDGTLATATVKKQSTLLTNNTVYELDSLSGATAATSSSITFGGSNTLNKVDSTVLYKFADNKFTKITWSEMVDDKANIDSISYVAAQDVQGKVDLGIVTFGYGAAVSAARNAAKTYILTQATDWGDATIPASPTAGYTYKLSDLTPISGQDAAAPSAAIKTGDKTLTTVAATNADGTATTVKYSVKVTATNSTTGVIGSATATITLVETASSGGFESFTMTFN